MAYTYTVQVNPMMQSGGEGGLQEVNHMMQSGGGEGGRVTGNKSHDAEWGGGGEGYRKQIT